MIDYFDYRVFSLLQRDEQHTDYELNNKGTWAEDLKDLLCEVLDRQVTIQENLWSQSEVAKNLKRKVTFKHAELILGKESALRDDFELLKRNIPSFGDWGQIGGLRQRVLVLTRRRRVRVGREAHVGFGGTVERKQGADKDIVQSLRESDRRICCV